MIIGIPHGCEISGWQNLMEAQVQSMFTGALLSTCGTGGATRKLLLFFPFL